MALGKGRNDRPTSTGKWLSEFRRGSTRMPKPSRTRLTEQRQGIHRIVRAGMGFTWTPRKPSADRPRSAQPDCLFPYLNGEDFNTHPEQQPSRWVINFFDWPLERAEQYPDLIEIVRRHVKPERDKVKHATAT